MTSGAQAPGGVGLRRALGVGDAVVIGLGSMVIVAGVLAVLASVVVVCLASGTADASRLDAAGGFGGVGGVLQAAGLLFFAFAGYARIATLGEEVRDPARRIPRAIPLALGITLVVYAAVAVAVLSVLGAEGLGHAAAPLADAVRSAGVPGLAPVVRVGAAVAALGSLPALILGVSRTTLAMARDRHLPGVLAAVHPRVPHRAGLTVGAVVAALAATVDVRGAIGFSSFGVLAYYAIANASAWTLRSAPASRVVPALGLLGCMTLAFALPGYRWARAGLAWARWPMPYGGGRLRGSHPRVGCDLRVAGGCRAGHPARPPAHEQPVRLRNPRSAQRGEQWRQGRSRAASARASAASFTGSGSEGRPHGRVLRSWSATPSSNCSISVMTS
jgi:amino acid transporter